MYKNLFLLSLFTLLLYAKKGEVNKNDLANPKLPLNELIKVENYLKEHKRYNQNQVIIVNYTLPSENYRFFVYSIKKKKILENMLVSHGAGSVVKNSPRLMFSNKINSNQSSLGFYEISTYYKGRFGWSYRLKGKNTTNDNAMKRAIVMHPYYSMKSKENGQPSPLSLGCFMLSQTSFDTVHRYISKSSKPMLIYAFYN